MKTKQKNYIRITLIICILLSVAGLIIYGVEKYGKTTYAYNNEEPIKLAQEINSDVKISNAEKLDLEKIIRENSTNTTYREEITVEEFELEYITKYRNNSKMYIGETAVSQAGRNGTQAITTKRVYDKDDNLISEEQVSAVVVKATINKIIDIGTKERTQEGIQGTTDGLDLNMALNIPSGFTLEQFKKALTDSKDKNKIFQENAEYFYYIEEQYDINGMFVAALGIHESGWGTSSIALNKKNLFGYGAYDSNPYNGAYSFESYSESIDLIARVLVKYYLNPKGKTIYDGQTATGQYYNGNTLSAVNKKYATDKEWGNKIYSHMKYLYSKCY